MKTKAFKIKCLTNLHVGDGDVNFNIIDNEVERDPVTGYPTINSSGVKGALRAFLTNNNKVEEFFGKPNSKSEDSTGGRIKILSANLGARAMRSSDTQSVYYLVSTEEILNEYNKICESLHCYCEANKEEKISEERRAEGKALQKRITKFGEILYTMENSDFDDVALPVLARNCLEPEKQNLWYEEIVPHESFFYFFAMANDDDSALLDNFANAISGNVIQFGGNASIGYGYCMVTELINEVGVSKNEI